MVVLSGKRLVLEENINIYYVEALFLAGQFCVQKQEKSNTRGKLNDQGSVR